MKKYILICLTICSFIYSGNQTRNNHASKPEETTFSFKDTLDMEELSNT